MSQKSQFQKPGQRRQAARSRVNLNWHQSCSSYGGYFYAPFKKCMLNLTKKLKSRSMVSLVVVMGSTLISAQSLAQSSIEWTAARKGTDYFEISYGNTHGGTVTSNSFSGLGPNDVKAEFQYGASPSVSVEYGVRKAWDLPVDMSVSVTQLKTPGTRVTIPAVSYSTNLSSHSITNFYAINTSYDVWSQANWRLFMGAGLGWANLEDADAQGLSGTLTVGARYSLSSSMYGIFKYKLLTIPESKSYNALLAAPIILPTQIMPILSIGIGIDF